MSITKQDNALNKKIDALGKRTQTWRNDVQIVLVECAYQAFEYSNVDPFTRLVGALKGADIKAVIKWAEQFAPCVWQKDKVAFRFNKSFVGEYDALFLMGNLWHDLATKPQNVSSTVDVIDAVRALIQRMENEIKAGKKTVTHSDAILDLKAVAGKYAAADHGNS